MPASVSERPMSSEERRYLQDRIDRMPTPFTELRRDAGVLISGWVGLTALLIAAWLALAWLVGATTGLDFGLGSAVAGWAMPLAAAASAAYLFVELGRPTKHRKKFRRSLLADLAAGRIVEEHYAFAEALRMQEQEHGGLIYFLRCADDAVLTHYDHESQDIGVQRGDPLTSSFRPCRRLTMVRAPASGLVIAKNFAGEALNAGEPLDLMAPPEKWPDDEALCAVRWQNLEAALCR